MGTAGYLLTTGRDQGADVVVGPLATLDAGLTAPAGIFSFWPA